MYVYMCINYKYAYINLLLETVLVLKDERLLAVGNSVERTSCLFLLYVIHVTEKAMILQIGSSLRNGVSRLAVGCRKKCVFVR